MAFNPSDILSQPGYGIPQLTSLDQQTPPGYMTPGVGQSAGGFPIRAGPTEQNLADILGLSRPQPGQVLEAPVMGSKQGGIGGGPPQLGPAALGPLEAGPIDDATGMPTTIPLWQRLILGFASPQIQRAYLQRWELQRKTQEGKVISDLYTNILEKSRKGDVEGASTYFKDQMSKYRNMPGLLREGPKVAALLDDRFRTMKQGKIIREMVEARVLNPDGTYKEGEANEAYIRLHKMLMNDADLGNIVDQMKDQAQGSLFKNLFEESWQVVAETGKAQRFAPAGGYLGGKPLDVGPTPAGQGTNEYDLWIRNKLGYTNVQLTKLQQSSMPEDQRLYAELKRREADLRPEWESINEFWHTNVKNLQEAGVDKNDFYLADKAQRQIYAQRAREAEISRTAEIGAETARQTQLGQQRRNIDQALRPLEQFSSILNETNPTTLGRRLIEMSLGLGVILRVPGTNIAVNIEVPSEVTALAQTFFSNTDEGREYRRALIEGIHQHVSTIWPENSPEVRYLREVLRESRFSNIPQAQDAANALTRYFQNQRQMLDDPNFGRGPQPTPGRLPSQQLREQPNAPRQKENLRPTPQKGSSLEAPLSPTQQQAMKANKKAAQQIGPIQGGPHGRPMGRALEGTGVSTGSQTPPPMTLTPEIQQRLEALKQRLRLQKPRKTTP